MSRQFVLPDLGEGLTEAEVVAILVREGDVIHEDAPLLEVETDKARVEIPSPLGGRVDRIHVKTGETVKVGAVLVTFGDAEGGRAPDGTTAAAPAATPPADRATAVTHSAAATPDRTIPAAPTPVASADRTAVAMAPSPVSAPGAATSGR